MKHQLAGGGGGIDVLCDALEGNTCALKRGDGLDEMLEGTAESIKAPDNERISFPQMRERGCQSWPLFLGTGYLIGVEVFCADACFP